MRRFFLPLLIAISTTDGNDENLEIKRKYEACGCETSWSSPPGNFQDNRYTNRAYELLCCAKWMESKGDFNVTWSFIPLRNTSEVFQLNRTTLSPVEGCYSQSLLTERLDPLDNGTYRCIITDQGGNTTERNMTVLLDESTQYLSAPIVSEASGPVYAKPGMSVNLSCSFFIGDNLATAKEPIYWRKTFFGADGRYGELIARTLPNTSQILPLKFKDSIVTTILQFTNLMSDVHFGDYTCQIVTTSSVVYQNISILKTADPKEREMKSMTALMSSFIAVILVIFCMTWILYRFRFAIIIKYKSLKHRLEGATNPALSEGMYDVFIVHGPSSLPWVYNVLLHKLEDVWNFKCFLPDRDIMCGEMTIETIIRELSNSRRILIVCTECLLESNWSGFVMFQGIFSCLSTPSKAVVINLITETSQLKGTCLKSEQVVKVLGCLKKIQWPQDPKNLKLVNFGISENPDGENSLESYSDRVNNQNKIDEVDGKGIITLLGDSKVNWFLENEGKPVNDECNISEICKDSKNIRNPSITFDTVENQESQGNQENQENDSQGDSNQKTLSVRIPCNDSQSQMISSISTPSLLRPSSNEFHQVNKSNLRRFSHNNLSQRQLNMITGSGHIYQTEETKSRPTKKTVYFNLNNSLKVIETEAEDEGIDNNDDVICYKEASDYSNPTNIEAPFFIEPRRVPRYSECSEDPTSPCSDTPFFFPNENRQEKTCRSIFQNLVRGNPEFEFWQKLLIRLPPSRPATSSNLTTSPGRIA